MAKFEELNSLLTTTEASSFLGVKPATLKNSRWTGKLYGTDTPKFLKLGRLVRYERQTLEEWFAQLKEQ